MSQSQQINMCLVISRDIKNRTHSRIFVGASHDVSIMVNSALKSGSGDASRSRMVLYNISDQVKDIYGK